LLLGFLPDIHEKSPYRFRLLYRRRLLHGRGAIQDG
jgi:hypothetical protein